MEGGRIKGEGGRRNGRRTGDEGGEAKKEEKRTENTTMLYNAIDAKLIITVHRGNVYLVCDERKRENDVNTEGKCVAGCKKS